ncbi:hypothetical protein EVB32_015 [Rhizobium phage RHph_TM39]|uniref:Uncharacterized protein n=1 Tax=Rhizobium phage RHph_TM30 TaxID=2509764 RepID=A0A7S5R513_9CAUD|nr:hypothetical protein PQC16_gp015 [Rhizobium phage RHph_TM30]QIG71122.1 hypothetical protein EVB93_015 [Rhizobium phage RHph_TM30]QIG77003.1 hypothetical protein EVB32_015 [Rhizobium phage RHph_TM39]QIG77344.1 hypothetical protein EVB61_016 [Rhizobium phage RHph_TM21B]QIG77602.1 hypothetical protein EVB64_015 [Rhizobium phage RHph_TM61]
MMTGEAGLLESSRPQMNKEFIEFLEANSKAVSAPAYWHARGIGYEWNLPCLVTGVHDKNALMENISGFVSTREEGYRVVNMFFGGRARLDVRKHEPNYLQVKVGVMKEHREVLERLMDANTISGGILTIKNVMWAIDPENHPGYDPIKKLKEIAEYYK